MSRSGLGSGHAATLQERLFLYDPARAIHICERYTGNSTGAEPTFRGHGPDPQHYQYSVASNVFYTPQ